MPRSGLVGIFMPEANIKRIRYELSASNPHNPIIGEKGDHKLLYSETGCRIASKARTREPGRVPTDYAFSPW